MKSTVEYVIVLFSLILFSSCEKGPAIYDGSYSFKTGGTMTFVTDKPDTVTSGYTSEMGQMHIMLTDDDDKPLMVTMNMLGGSVVAFEAKENDGEIELLPRKRLFKININGISYTDVELEMSGRGQKYKDIIVLDLSLEGSFSRFDTEYRVSDCDIECVATRNKN